MNWAKPLHSTSLIFQIQPSLLRLIIHLQYFFFHMIRFLPARQYFSSSFGLLNCFPNGESQNMVNSFHSCSNAFVSSFQLKSIKFPCFCQHHRHSLFPISWRWYYPLLLWTWESLGLLVRASYRIEMSYTWTDASSYHDPQV